MCGIYGFAAAGDDLGPPTEIGRTLRAMDRSIEHRGPDDSGTYFDDRCALGMRRLSIIDLDGGRQPISNEDDSVWVVFNGEIYNYKELRDLLLRRGHHLRTTSDTEVLVHLYEDEGAALVERLSGMFGFALWDRRRGELLLVRDRLGIKPLYYADTGAGLVFGSELKSLLCHPAVPRRLSPLALSHYLSFGTTPPDRAILDGVNKLPPAHLLRYRAGALRVERYWDLRPPPRLRVDAEEAAREVRRLVRAAVRSHLVADVPVGAFLSGGIDSATVVGTMAELGARPKTFSIGFEEADFDELDYARLIARRFDTDHHELVLRPDAWALTEKLVWYLDEPFADVSAVPTFLVSQLAAAHVKVVLSGDGGDEVFAGYDRYVHALAEERRFGWLPGPARRALGALGVRLPAGARGRNYLVHLSYDADGRYVDSESLFPAHLKAQLLGRELMMQLHNEHCAPAQPVAERVALLRDAPGDFVQRLLYFDTMTYLPLDILTKVDRMTMAHSLEARPPLLDHALVEQVFALPASLKLDAAMQQKAVLKRAVADLLPPEVLHRRKRGFGVPIRQWFRGPLRQPARALLTERRTLERGYLDAGAVHALIDEHERGRRDQSLRMWSLMVLELWCRAYLDAAHTAERSREVAHG